MKEVAELRKYAFVDALRGYAILGVVMVHSSQAVAPTSAWLQRFANSGARGVQLFFVASALTLCLSWQARSLRELSPVRNFYLRRVFRVLPMFYLAIAFYALLYGMGPRYAAPNGLCWWFIPLTALCLHGFHPEVINSVVPGGWSIAVEMSFYLVLPILLRWVRSFVSVLGLLAFSLLLYKLSCAALPYLLRAQYPAEQQYLLAQFCDLTFFGQLPVFALGLLTYTALQAPLPFRRWLGAAGTAGYVLAKIVAPLGSRTYGLLTHHLVASVALACFALLLSSAEGSFLTRRWIVRIGRLSYSMYLVHFAVLELLKRGFAQVEWSHGDLASLVCFAAATALSALISFGTYEAVERPGIALGKHLIDRLEATDARRLAAAPSRGPNL